jgi:hypothetical protein
MRLLRAFKLNVVSLNVFRGVDFVIPAVCN